MLVFKIVVAIFVIFIGIPNQLIDYKHRKKNAYEPGNAWAYYSKLSQDGNIEGKFMMWSGYCGIGLILAVLAYLAFRLFTA